MREGKREGRGLTRDNVDICTALTGAFSRLNGASVDHEGRAVDSAHCLNGEVEGKLHILDTPEEAILNQLD